MFERAKKFIIHIQNSDEPVRRRWLFVLSGGSMFIVIALWVGYINVIMQKPNEPAGTAEATSETIDPGFAKVFNAGIKAVTNEAQKQLNAKNEITIERPKGNFQLPPDKLPPIPKTKLP